MYVTQATQNRDGTVPLVAERDGYLRVFLVADQPGTAAPVVRARIYHGEVLKESLVIPPPVPTVPTAVNQGDLNSSWNVKLPGALIQPGLRIQAEIDAGNGAAVTRGMEVAALAPLRIRFVPIHQSVNGLTGRVSEANKDQFLVMTRKIHPIPGYDADIRSAYTTTENPFDPQGNIWEKVLHELNAVRVAEGSDRYYYGVVRTTYSGGVLGIGFVPGRTALGWDEFQNAPGNMNASGIMAHEIGHNWGRRHAPCGGAAGNDPTYPYPVGQIGAFGIDVETGEVKVPSGFTDIMGYCIVSWWISDYTYHHIFHYRKQNDIMASTAGAMQPSLLVWGRVHNGQLVLEPAFQVTTRPSLPTSSGPFRIQGLDASGAILFSHSFAAEPISDIPGDQRTFAFAIPLSSERASQLATLRLTGNGKQVERHSVSVRTPERSKMPQSAPIVTLREGPEKVSLRLNRESQAMAMIRDPRTGEILSLVRDGAASLQTSAGDLEVILSDGVRSTAHRVRLRVPGH